MPLKLLLFTIFSGSTSAHVQSDTDKHPFEPCPDTPNCVIQSIAFETSGDDLYRIALNVMNEFSPHELFPNSQKLQIDAVFRIRLFGFKDDVNIAIEPAGNHSYLHIKSASRVGHGDLGVNYRRVNRIVNKLKEKL